MVRPCHALDWSWIYGLRDESLWKLVVLTLNYLELGRNYRSTSKSQFQAKIDKKNLIKKLIDFFFILLIKGLTVTTNCASRSRLGVGTLNVGPPGGMKESTGDESKYRTEKKKHWFCLKKNGSRGKTLVLFSFVFAIHKLVLQHAGVVGLVTACNKVCVSDRRASSITVIPQTFKSGLRTGQTFPFWIQICFRWSLLWSGFT